MTLFSKGDTAPRALKKRYAQTIFKRLDLITDCGLRHAQFLRSGREVFQPGSGFEHPDGGQGRQGLHRPYIS